MHKFYHKPQDSRYQNATENNDTILVIIFYLVHELPNDLRTDLRKFRNISKMSNVGEDAAQ